MHLAGEEPRSANGMPLGSREQTTSLAYTEIQVKRRVVLTERNLSSTRSDRRASGFPR